MSKRKKHGRVRGKAKPSIAVLSDSTMASMVAVMAYEEALGYARPFLGPKRIETVRTWMAANPERAAWEERRGRLEAAMEMAGWR